MSRRIVASDNNKKLIECIKQHQAVVLYVILKKSLISFNIYPLFIFSCIRFSFKELLENTYHTYLLFQLVGSVGLICMSALRILVVPSILNNSMYTKIGTKLYTFIIFLG